MAASARTGSSAAASSSDADARGPIGLDTWRDLNQLPVNPVGAQTREFSSFDRTDGNNDGFDGTYSCLKEVSQGCVIAEDHGAGELDTLWFTRDGGPETKTGDITIILDGTTVVNAPLTSVVNGDLGAPFVYPLVANYTQNSGGNYIAVPMTYHSSMEVITQNQPDFYQIFYRHFASADGVSTFSPSSDSGSDVISMLKAAGTQDPIAPLPGATTTNTAFQVAPGHRATLAQVSGPGEITALSLSIPSLLGMTQPPQEISYGGRGFAVGGSSQFTVAINPGNDGVRLTRILNGTVGEQEASVTVDGQAAGSWQPLPEQWGLWVPESIDIPASLTQGKSQITVRSTFVSSTSNFGEYGYQVYSDVGGQLTETDHFSLGPGNSAQEQAHDYTITDGDFDGNTTNELLPSTTDPAAVNASDDILENARIVMSFDGQQTVDSPLGEFFGSGLGKWEVDSLFDHVSSGQGGTLTSWWPMPYARSATISLVNDSSTPITSGTVQVTSAPGAQWATELGTGGNAGYFRTTSHLGPASTGRDVNWLTATGSGKLVGVTMTEEGTNNTQGRGFMEGDQHTWYDGSRTPQLNGTGTEDIGLGGWYFNQGMFTGAITGDTFQQGAQYGCAANCTGEYRLFVDGSIPFTSGIVSGQEHGSTDQVPAIYGTTAYWYGRPQITGVQTDSLTIGDAASEAAHQYQSATSCPAQPVTSTYEADDGPEDGLPPISQYTFDVGQAPSPVSFTMSTSPANQGVVLQRTSDQNIGYQAVEVYVDGQDAGQWQQPLANTYHQWLDDSFEIPASLTSGQAELHIELVPVTGSFTWNAASYRAVSLVAPGGPAWAPGSGQARLSAQASPAQTATTAATAATAATVPQACAAVVSSISPSSAEAGEQVTVTGSGFGSSQGSGYVVIGDQGSTWGAPVSYWWLGAGLGPVAPLTVDSWSDNAITVTLPAASAGLVPGTKPSVQVVTDSGNVSAVSSVTVPPSSNLADYYDGTGISSDSDPQAGNFDGTGSAYSGNALAAAGLTPGASFTADGTTLTWPDVAVGDPDMIHADGQTIALSASGPTLVVVGASHNGSSSGPLTVTYTDGSTQTFTLTLSDWWSNTAPPGGGIVATDSYLNNPNGRITQENSIYYDAFTLAAGKTVQDVTLPSSANMSVFTLGVG